MNRKWLIFSGLTTSFLAASLVVAQLGPGKKFWLKERLPVLKPEVNPQSGLTCARVPQLMQFFLLNHVTWKNFDKELEDRTLHEYIKWIDGSKTLLLAGDVEKN